MWVLWDITPWTHIWPLLVVIMLVMLRGHSHFLPLLEILCVHGLKHWLLLKRGHLIS